jgi:hypothetical protein
MSVFCWPIYCAFFFYLFDYPNSRIWIIHFRAFEFSWKSWLNLRWCYPGIRTVEEVCLQLLLVSRRPAPSAMVIPVIGRRIQTSCRKDNTIFFLNLLGSSWLYLVDYLNSRMFSFILESFSFAMKIMVTLRMLLSRNQDGGGRISATITRDMAHCTFHHANIRHLWMHSNILS